MTTKYLRNQIKLIQAVLRIGCAIVPTELILFSELQRVENMNLQLASTDMSLMDKQARANESTRIRDASITGREAALPSAIGPPPPLRVAMLTLLAMTRRDKPANEAGRRAMMHTKVQTTCTCRG